MARMSTALALYIKQNKLTFYCTFAMDLNYDLQINIHDKIGTGEKVPIQGSKKTLSGRPGQVDFPVGQVTFSPSLPNGQGPRQAIRRLNF